MKKLKLWLVTTVLTAAFTGSFAVSAWAGSWQRENGYWWYDNGDGTRARSQWLWLDGNKDGIAECYCFDRNGHMYSGETTPDGYWVNEMGAWTEKGVVQFREVPVGDEYAQDGLFTKLEDMVKGTRESNREQFKTEKEFKDFDQFDGEVTVYYNEAGQVIYLTKHCKGSYRPPIRNLDIEENDSTKVYEKLRALGYPVEAIDYYKVRIHLNDGYYAEYKADTKFIQVGKE